MRCAHDGHQAVELAGDFRPDVVILDIGLPGMNGLDACRAIRTAEWGRSIFIVALTGWGQEEDQRKTRDAGFDAHLVKPVEPGELSRLIGALTEGKPATVR